MRPPSAASNAGASTAGRAFGARNCDFLFTIIADIVKAGADVREIKALAAAQGRNVDVFTTCYVVCRPSRREAEDFHRYYVDENADWEAVDHLMRLQGQLRSRRPGPPAG